MTLGLLVLGSCKNNLPKREQDYIEKLEESYHEIKKEYPEAILKKVEYTLSSDIKTLGDTVKVIDFQETYQLGDSCIKVFPDTVEIEKAKDCGGNGIEIGELEMTLQEAIDALKKINFRLPNSSMIKIQKPSNHIHPLYVYGSDYEGQIAVDMRTKKIYKL